MDKFVGQKYKVFFTSFESAGLLNGVGKTFKLSAISLIFVICFVSTIILLATRRKTLVLYPVNSLFSHFLSETLREFCDAPKKVFVFTFIFPNFRYLSIY